MKKLFLMAIFGLMTKYAVAQKYLTKTGVTSFAASQKAFVPVKAVNKKSTAILNAETGEVASQLFITDFDFKVSLMQEHFNENYMDSDKYPKATFVGKLEGFDIKKIDIEKEFPLSGILTIKGQEKPIETTAILVKQDDSILVNTRMIVSPKDFGIKIPSIVSMKIAKKVNIKINYLLSEKK